MRIILSPAKKMNSNCDFYKVVTEKEAKELQEKDSFASCYLPQFLENRIENPRDMQNFNRLGFIFREDLSSETEYIFDRKEADGKR